MSSGEDIVIQEEKIIFYSNDEARLVTLFIDFSELRALNHQIMTMEDWVVHVNKFLAFLDQEILENTGKISHEMAVAKAYEQYEKFRIKQDKLYISDFDKNFEKYLKGGDR